MRLQEYRKTVGMDQKDLAEKLGIAVQTVSSWETGARRPNIDMLVKLTEVFGCTADELLGIERKEPEENKRETVPEIVRRRTEEARRRQEG